MTGDGVYPGEASPRAAQAHGDAMIEQILAGRRSPESEAEKTMSLLVDALRGPGTADELAGLDATATAFVAARREAVGTLAPVVVLGSSRSGRPALRMTAAVAGAAASLVLVGAAAAAYTGSLPTTFQRLAHDAVGAPAPAVEDPSASSGEGVGPSAAPGSDALVGLCKAFAGRGPSFSADGSVAYRNLLAAATARQMTVAAYCSSVVPTTGPEAPTATSSQPGPSSTPPGQSNRPSTPPGLVGKPTPPGQSNRPSTPPDSRPSRPRQDRAIGPPTPARLARPTRPVRVRRPRNHHRT